MARVLHIPDLHAPFIHRDALRFCKYIYKTYKCNKVVFAGDVVDNAAISYHETNPDGMSAGDELVAAQKAIKPWVKAFPKATVTIGNHDCLSKRKAHTYGIPEFMIRDYSEIYDTPGWDWVIETEVDGVLYLHGKGYGKSAALNTALMERRSIAQGHAHSFAGVQFSTSTKDRIFGLNSGCLIDIDAYAFAYQKKFSVRPVLGASVIIDGIQPIFIPMKLK